MTTSGLSPVPVALGSASTETEEGRAFFQDRLRLYTGWVFVLAFGFYLLSAVNVFALGVRVLVEPGNIFHFLACLTIGSVWLITRQVSCSWQRLLLLDAVSVVMTCFMFAAMSAGFALSQVDYTPDPTQSFLIGQLASMSTVLTRAVALPSTPTRTFWLGVASFLPQILLATFVYYTAGDIPLPPGLNIGRSTFVFFSVLSVAGWCGVGLAISTVGSRVIFGLRVEADKVKRLGQYFLEKKIGEGGMGVVYRASHAMLRRPTAIKLLPPERAGEDSIRRFEREVQLTAKLSHPSTVAIFDYGRTPTGLFYYAMEYLDGLNLEELVKASGPQEPGRVIHILQQVSGALTEAHDIGLIHRDIKPANIILCSRGGVPDVAKVVDFGLVKAVVADETEGTMMATSQHILTGTPMYMAPEAIKGERFVDGRSDLYALGAVGYYLLTGEPVFPSGTVVEVVAHHLHTVPEPPSVRSGLVVPPELETIVMRCLEKSPDARFATAHELNRALSHCAESVPWSLERAADLWATIQTTHSDGGPSSDVGPHATLAIDVGDRVES